MAVETEALSFKEFLAQRREQLHQERTFVLPVPGFDGRLAARYKALSYEEMRKIGVRNESVINSAAGKENFAGELDTFADTLVFACIELLQSRGDDEYVSLEHRWTTRAASELFGIDLPEGAGARDAVRAVLPGTQLALHMGEYQEALADVLPGVSESLAGESEPSAEG